MITFKQYLEEGYKNLLTPEQKEKYAEEAFNQLKATYAGIGGLKGSGFNSLEDFISNVHFWKLKIDHNTGKILAGAYYKDSNGRKRIAVSSDGSIRAKKFIADIMKSDLFHERAYVEQSEASLKFLIKTAGIDFVKKYAIAFDQIENVLHRQVFKPEENDRELKLNPELKDFFYVRSINGHKKTKIALGKPGIKIH